VFAPSDTLEEVEAIDSNSDQPIQINVPNSPMGRKATLKEKIGAAFSRGMGSKKRANTVGGTRYGNTALNQSSPGISKPEETTEEEQVPRRPNLVRAQSHGTSPQTTPKATGRKLEKVVESEKEESGFGSVVRRLSRRATTGGGKRRKRKVDTDIPPSPPLPVPNANKGQGQERLSRYWQNLGKCRVNVPFKNMNPKHLSLFQIFLKSLFTNLLHPQTVSMKTVLVLGIIHGSGLVPNPKALSSFPPRAPLALNSNASTARSPPLVSPPAYTPGSTRRKEWMQLNGSSGDLK
jgi:hypothetical protein